MTVKIQHLARATILAAFTALTFGGMANAKDDGHSGYYASLQIGASIPSDANFDGTIGGASQSVDVEYDTGYMIGGALGRSWGRIGAVVPRTELELSYRESDVDGIAFSGNGPAAEVNVRGSSSSTTLFANAIADLPVAGTRITPYAGLGIGVAFTQQDFVYGPGVRVGDSDEVFAAQLIAGVSYNVTERVAVTADGRYQRAFGVESRRVAPNGAVTGTIEDDLDIFSVSVGLRFKF